MWMGMEIESAARMGYSVGMKGQFGGVIVRPFRFLHTADIHLGTPFLGASQRVSETWLERLKDASYHVFERIVRVALDHDVQFVTISGDLFDCTSVPMSVFFELRRGFETLQRAGIKVFLCHGNHDPLDTTHPFTWPDNVVTFPPLPASLSDDDVVPSYVFETAGQTRVQVSGFSYRGPQLFASLAAQFVRRPDVDYAIGLYHGVVGSASGHANYAATSLAALEQRNFDFWGLGHIHQASVLKSQNPVVLYPGNPQGRHIKESGARGVYIVDVLEDGRAKLQFVPTDTVRFATVKLALDDIGDLAEVREQLRGEIAHSVQRNAQHGGGVVLRIQLSGRTHLHDVLNGQEAVMADALQADLEHLQWPVCIERVDVDTEPPLDRAALAHSRTFVGEVLRLCDDYQQDAERTRSVLRGLLQDLYHPGTGLSVDNWSDEDVLRLLHDAEMKILTQVERAVDAT